MQFVSEIIGEEYLNWKAGDKVFITAPTGTGKTSFVKNILLDYARENGKRILYLVNRSILKEQLEKDFSDYRFDWNISIKLYTYQQLESMYTSLVWDRERFCYVSKEESAFYDFLNVDYIICDECHYFLADSNFNTNTQIVFEWLQTACIFPIQIYISATMELLKQTVELNKQKYDQIKYSRATNINDPIIKTSLWQTIDKSKTFEYCMDSNSNDWNIKIIRNADMIADTIIQNSQNNKKKWLIFIDDKSVGKKIKKEIEQAYPSESVIMIDSGYKKDAEMLDEVSTISKNSCQNKRFLITTSVMDNGISLNDVLLRNVIVNADNYIEFIQMVGRKRLDNFKFDLYIVDKSKEYFRKRYNQCQNILESIKKYYEMKHNFCSRLFESRNMCYGNIEKIVSNSLNAWLINEVYSHRISSCFFEKVFYPVNGVWYLNELAVDNLLHKKEYYKEMMELLENDELAFVKEQLTWLKVSKEDWDTIIKNSQSIYKDTAIAFVSDLFEKNVGRELKKDEYKKLYRSDSTKQYFSYLAKEIDINDEKIKNAIKCSILQNDHTMTISNMNTFLEYYKIPYCVNNKKNGNAIISYSISKKEN